MVKDWAVGCPRSYGVWEAYQTPRGTLAKADAIRKAESKNNQAARNQARFAKKGK